MTAHVYELDSFLCRFSTNSISYTELDLLRDLWLGTLRSAGMYFALSDSLSVHFNKAYTTTNDESQLRRDISKAQTLSNELSESSWRNTVMVFALLSNIRLIVSSLRTYFESQHIHSLTLQET